MEKKRSAGITTIGWLFIIGFLFNLLELPKQYIGITVQPAIYSYFKLIASKLG